MTNDSQTPQRPRNPLLRQVVVPSWLQALLLTAFFCSFVSLLVSNPLQLLVLLGVSVAFVSLIVIPLRRRAGQSTSEQDKAEVKAAPTREAALAVAWRQFRTYQVWYLTLLVVASALVLLESAGVTTF